VNVTQVTKTGVTQAPARCHLQSRTDKKRHRLSQTVPSGSGGNRTRGPNLVTPNSLHAYGTCYRTWEWTDDANRQPMALGHEELAEVLTAWPLLSADLRQAILASVRSADVIAEASCAATE